MICPRHAQYKDIQHIDTMLRSLAEELGDPYLASIDHLRKAVFGEYPSCHAQIAIRADDNTPMGIALYSPLFSTTTGGAGLYLSDLWVAPQARSTGLGARLIAAASLDATARWQSVFVKLCVYHDNLSAVEFYDRLGFTDTRSSEHYLVLKEKALENLISNMPDVCNR